MEPKILSSLEKEASLPPDKEDDRCTKKVKIRDGDGDVNMSSDVEHNEAEAIEVAGMESEP